MKTTISIVVIAAFSLLMSCDKKVQPRAMNIVQLIDISRSRDSTVINWYINTACHSIIQNMGMRDKTIVMPIDLFSEVSSQEIYKVDFAQNDYSNELAGLQKDEIEHDGHEDSLLSAESHLRTTFGSGIGTRTSFWAGTDVFGALSIAQKYSTPGYRNLLVLFSDMLEYTDKGLWNFEDHLNNIAEVDQYVEKASFIDLHDFEIIVVTGAQKAMRPAKYKAVKTFWEKYFSKCHATLIDYSSGNLSTLEKTVKN